MAKFPKIDSPCPYKANLAAVMDGDFCRMCKRDVFDLSGWSDGERTAFLRGCETEVCVRYTLPMPPALAAAALAAAAIVMPAHAQNASASAAVSVPDEELDYIIVGGIKNPKQANLVEVEDPADAAMADLPVIEEADPVATPVKVTPAS